MKTILCCGLVLSALLRTTFATEYHVAPNGSDEADGLSWATPLQTIKKGVDKALTAGDVVWVSNGQYAVSAQISVSRGIKIRGFGDREATLVIGGYPAATNRLFYLNHADALLDSLTITNGYLPNDNNYGGGVLSDAGTIRNCVFAGNRGGYGGGGLSCAATLVTNCVFRDNWTQDGWGYGGGGVYIRKGSLMVDCTVVSNRAGANGGGVYFSWWDVPARVTRCRITGNTAGTDGGGVALASSNAGTLDTCVVSNNLAKNGGGVYAVAGCWVTNCIVKGNRATTEGGGIYLNGGGVAADCTIVDNEAGVLIANNGGGGVKFQSGGTVKNSLIAWNRGYGYGGGAYFVGPGVFENCIIVSNRTVSATGVGGGLHSYLGGHGITNCLIAENLAASKAGGINFSATSTVQNCTIYGNRVTNSSGTSCGGIFMNAGSRIQNTILYANTALSSADWSGGIYSNCCTSVTNGMAGGNNLAANPLLRDPAGGDYRPVGGSPCVNAGLNAEWMASAVDLAFKPRVDPHSGRVDIGAYEFYSMGTIIGVE